MAHRPLGFEYMYDLQEKKEVHGPSWSPDFHRLQAVYLSEGFILAYLEAHHKIDKNQQCQSKAALQPFDTITMTVLYIAVYCCTTDFHRNNVSSVYNIWSPPITDERLP